MDKKPSCNFLMPYIAALTTLGVFAVSTTEYFNLKFIPEDSYFSYKEINEKYELKSNINKLFINKEIVVSKDIKIQDLTLKINKLEQKILSLEKKNLDLKILINKNSNIEKIKQSISEFIKDYSDVSYPTQFNYEKDYNKAINKYESILAEIKTYKLTKEYKDFIKNIETRLYEKN